MATNLFNPVLGTEERVLAQGASAGSVYFTTDTRKIYLDVDENNNKIPMGGNIGLFYGNMKLTSPPVDGQTEFEFKITEIIGNESGLKTLAPNVDDLILNTDGCFYKVTSVDGTNLDTVLTTQKLTIAGTGGGGGTSDGTGSLAGMSMSRLRFDRGQTIMYQSSCPVSFAVKITDDLGDALTGNVGTYDLYINSIKKQSGNVVGTTVADVTNLETITKNEINTIDVGPYLMLGENINVKISVNGVNGGVITRAGTVSTTNMTLVWEYDETDINNWDQAKSSMDLEWTVTGNLEKTTHIIINDDYENVISLPPSKSTTQNFTLDFVERNLWHGAHKIEMYATAIVSGSTVSTDHVIKNIIVAKEGDESAIISCGLFDTNLTQYNTVQIPIIIYDPTNTGETALLRLIENGEERDKRENVANSTVETWAYTPVVSGPIILTIQCNGAEKSITVYVEPVEVDINEKGGYVFKFKASEFASNGNVQRWNSNGINATFTSTSGDPAKFDWYNGGLKSESDGQGGARQYLCIKAGSKMTINYAPWAIDARGRGKCLKVIFKATKCKDYDGQVLSCYDGYTGLVMRAQNATFHFANKRLDVSYCEDEYMEFELDITPNSTVAGYKKRYIRPWLDGVPCGLQLYASTDNFESEDSATITIGSDDCDVYLYMIKMYENHLTDDEHLDNFIADAPNASEIVARFERNDILDDNGISYQKLAEKNPNCRVHLYEMARMTRTKSDPIDNCIYTQYHGSRDPILSADNVTVKVQGTSSAAYGLAAFNLDSKFKNGFKNLVKDTTSDGWSMSSTAIPVNYFCTKVNVASAEGTNNALNQEWYNKFQPYPTIVRAKKKGDYNTARDCMEFVPGVVFINDRNPVTNDETYGGKGDNVFKDTIGYCDTVDENTQLLTSSYPKMYSIGCMGNSKKNVEVFHDEDNPYECCVENGDNQLPGQWMTDIQGGYSLNKTFYPVSISSISASDKTMCPDGVERDNRTLWENAMDEIYGFRYPDGIDEVKERDSKYAESMIQGWYDFVYWMAHSNPQEAYSRVIFTEGYYSIDYEDEDAFNEDNGRTRFILNDDGEYEPVTEYDEAAEYFVLLTAQQAYEQRTYNLYRWVDMEHTDYRLIGLDEPYEESHTVLNQPGDMNAYYKLSDHIFGATNKKLPSPQTFGEYEFRGYKAPDVVNGDTLNLSQYHADYTPVVKGLKISTYANEYTHDTTAYRMAKMLSECEDHLCMDSVVYHYLFIERHSMVDNVAKNTFWSTEDGKVWNLTKNYDNDTSDGNDNQGKLTLTYGCEPGDTDDSGVSIFNAGNSVWLYFIRNLYDVCHAMYIHLDNKGAWSPTAYLKEHTKWQKAIPERCWIEDYYRKYVRPYEVYGSQMFIEMHDGGQKVHQRAQYEKYQDYYISSKYFGNTCSTNMFTLRAEGADITKISLPVQLYADCYIRGAYGSGTTNPNLSIRCKRNTDIVINSPITNATDATIYLWPSNLYQQLGDKNTGLNDYGLTQFEAANAKKLRTVSLGVNGGVLNKTLTKITFESNENLEKVYVAKYEKADNLDLTDSPGLLLVDGRNSGFATVVLPANAPTTSVQLNKPSTLSVSNLSALETFTIADYSEINDLQLTDIDRSPGINSKTIVENAINKSSKFKRYKLRDVLWTISDISEINISNGTINILESLLSLKPSTDASGKAMLRKDALTGTLTIAPGEENFNLTNDQALRIYETYAKAKEDYVRVTYKDEDTFNNDNRTKYIYEDSADKYTPVTNYNPAETYYVKGLAAQYPNLDIIFADNTLYNVNIYDGDENIKWSRKTVAGKKVDEDFLKYGPDGSFTSQNVQKTSTAEYEYVFLNHWIIKDDDGKVLKELFSSEPIYDTPINGNIHMYPQFNTRKRTYTVQVKMKDPSTGIVSDLCESTSYEYGTPLATVIPQDTIPVASTNNGLGLLEVYDFKGYSLIEGSMTTVSSNYTVTGDATLWAVFKKETDIRKIVHPEWFEIVDSDAVYSETGALAGNYANGIRGVTIKPKYILKGKITIPATMKVDGVDKPVIKIGYFCADTNDLDINHANGLTSPHKITHVFMEDNNQICAIEKCGFHRVETLEYFDFEKCPVRDIGMYAFTRCEKLVTTSVGYQVRRLRAYCFSRSISSKGVITTLFLPSTLERVDDAALSMLQLAADSTLQIGAPGDLSNLDLKNSTDNSFTTFNTAKYKAINFYTQKYSSVMDKPSGNNTVWYYFSKALNEKGDLYIGTA